jgi:hypothetical protein
VYFCNLLQSLIAYRDWRREVMQMAKPLRVLAILLPVVILPWAANAQSTTKYDGSYAGVSHENITQGIQSKCGGGSSNSYTLTIANGAATMPWGTESSGTLKGTVSQTGALTMSGWSGMISVHLYGQIDPSGGVTAQVSTGNCGFRMVWKKQ